VVKKLLRLLVIIFVALTPATPIMAATVVDVTITATPLVSTGITNFTIVYVSDQRLDLSWGFSGLATQIMIRGKYGSYPADIPNEDTAPTDGYLAYYGNGTSVSDTSMNFDENAGILYYKAWGQKADGHWYTNTSTGWKESREVVLIGLILIGMIGTYFALSKRNVLFAVGTAALWFFLIAYTRSNPLPNITSGSSTDNIFIGVCTAFSVGTMLSVFIMNYKERNEANKSVEVDKYEQIAGNNKIRHGAKDNGYESPEEYAEKVKAASKNRRR
jgi:hypothetical protein